MSRVWKPKWTEPFQGSPGIFLVIDAFNSRNKLIRGPIFYLKDHNSLNWSALTFKHSYLLNQIGQSEQINQPGVCLKWPSGAYIHFSSAVSLLGIPPHFSVSPFILSLQIWTRKRDVSASLTCQLTVSAKAWKDGRWIVATRWSDSKKNSVGVLQLHLC